MAEDPKNINLQSIQQEAEMAAAISDAFSHIVTDLKNANSELEIRFDPLLQRISANAREYAKIQTTVIGSIGKANKLLLSSNEIRNNIRKNIKFQNELTGLQAILEEELLKSTGERAKALQKLLPYLQEANDQISTSIGLWQDSQDELEKLRRTKLQPLIGIFKGLAKIPILGDMLDASYAAERMERAMRPIAQNGKGMTSFLSIFKEGFKGLFLNIGGVFSKLSLLAAPFLIIIKLIKLWIGGMMAADKMNTSIAKNLGVQKEFAQKIRSIYVDNSLKTKDIFLSTQNQVEAAEQLNVAYGTGNIFTERILHNQINLNKWMELSVEESIALNKIFINQNMTSEDFLETIVLQTQAVNQQKKVQLNYKGIYQDIAKLTGVVLSNYKGQIPLIANAVAQVKALGLSMDEASSISSHLLDWQSSIEDELQAELLTGRGLNAERARGLALMGKTSEATQALMQDAGLTFDSFSNLNVIVKESLSKYMGITVDKLSDALLIQKNMVNLTAQQKQLIKDTIPDEAKRNEFYKEMNDPKNITRGLMELTIQQKFNQALAKAKEIFSNFVSGGMLDKLTNTLTGIINKLQNMFGSPGYAGKSASVLSNIKNNTNIGSQQKQLAEFLQKNISSTEAGPGLFRNTWFGSPITSMMDRMNKVNLEILERINSGELKDIKDIKKYYAIRSMINFKGNFLKKDQPQQDFVMKGNKVIPFRKDDIIMGGTKLLGGENNEVVNLLREMVSAIKEGKGVYLDGQKVGMAMAKGSSNIP